jgi:DNA polymerase elongation subunit (family B)
MKIAFDIETATGYSSLEEAPGVVQDAWVYYWKRRKFEENESDAYKKHAGLIPEFGKIVCISAKAGKEKVVSFSTLDEVYNDEKDVLEGFSAFVNQFDTVEMVGHNIVGFDLPYVNVRCVANELTLIQGFCQYKVKPWEAKHIDTQLVWKGENYKSTQSASLLSCCMVLGIPSPKQEIDGSQVSDVYWKNGTEGLTMIVKYCEGDVEAVGALLNKQYQLGMISPATKR